VSVVAIGLHARSLPLHVFERLSLDVVSRAKLRAHLVSSSDVGEAVVVSTCNRLEVYVMAERFHGAYAEIRNGISLIGQVAPEDFSDQLYAHYDLEAAEHLFGVSTGLDSAVVGEHEILGQVRSSWEEGLADETSGAGLNLLFRHALETGKRVRTETGIARGIASISQAAVAMATEHLGALRDKRVVILGAGEMGEGMALSLADAGPAEILVVNRTPERADALAARVGGRALPLEELGRALIDTDVLLTSTGANSLLVDHASIEPTVEARGGRDLLIVDIAVPRDVDSAVGSLAGVTLLDMDDLRAFAERGLASRRDEIGAARIIVEAELERFAGELSAREVAPLVAALRMGADATRSAELERYRTRLDAQQLNAVDALTKAIVAKLLHQPTVELKRAAGTARGARLAESMRELFDL